MRAVSISSPVKLRRAAMLWAISGAWLSVQAEPLQSESTTTIPVVSHKNNVSPSYAIPQFAVDPAWPALPGTWLTGQVPGLAVDKRDNTVWVLHRPASIPNLSLGLTNGSASCCEPAPFVMQFSVEGKLLNSWGGPEGDRPWPENVHGLYVDAEGKVWIGGNGKGDHQIFSYTRDGEFVRAFGEAGKTDGNTSEHYLGNPADIVVDDTDVMIADGYINKRVVRLSKRELDFEQAWGAWGNAPGGGTREGSFDTSQAASGNGDLSTGAEHFGDIVHCVDKSQDGRIYVCDRRNNRLQIFRKNDEGQVLFEKNLEIAAETGGLGTATDVAFSPDNKYLYVADMMNGRIWILWHDTYEVLGSIGRNGRYAGEFTWLHSIETDQDGNLYTSEVSTGQRVQKFVLTGFSKPDA
ncbi:hypothetical protein Q4520_02480 [Alteromonas sp. 1_MG-2023]|uniref:hypothetical protein n=1 Tax=Alteromonas sp. 1_MG-2023 TaxID=3062669 RepID=UPI0026E1FD59|nr:hypothetical protein [Alteromonas sp. 1_MG-2023]MDO6474264.1 hypothetical protein [Alteromonas sp. 1_MG-2023]